MAKRKGGFFSRLVKWAFGEYPPELGEALLTHTETNEITDLPNSCNNVELGGTMTVGGRHCTTVGEYKAAYAQATKNDPAYIYTPGEQS